MHAPNGGLFATDFLRDSITELEEWEALTGGSLDGIEHSLREILNRFPTAQTPNESQTEDDLIWPVLAGPGRPRVDILPPSAEPVGAGRR